MTFTCTDTNALYIDSSCQPVKITSPAYRCVGSWSRLRRMLLMLLSLPMFVVGLALQKITVVMWRRVSCYIILEFLMVSQSENCGNCVYGNTFGHKVNWKKEGKLMRITESAGTPYGGFRRDELGKGGSWGWCIFLWEGVVQGRSERGQLCVKWNFKKGNKKKGELLERP